MVYTNIANINSRNFIFKPSDEITNDGGWVAMYAGTDQILGWAAATASGPVSIVNGILFAGSTNGRGTYAMDAVWENPMVIQHRSDRVWRCLCEWWMHVSEVDTQLQQFNPFTVCLLSHMRPGSSQLKNYRNIHEWTPHPIFFLSYLWFQFSYGWN